MGKHTPGPWYYSHEQGNGQGEYINTLRRWRIDSESRALMLTAEAWNTFVDDRHIWEEVEANVHLATAAPELLEALKSIVEHGLYDTFDTGIGFVDMPNKYFKQALAAIAKAEGEPQ